MLLFCGPQTIHVFKHAWPCHELISLVYNFQVSFSPSYNPTCKKDHCILVQSMENLKIDQVLKSLIYKIQVSNTQKVQVLALNSEGGFDQEFEISYIPTQTRSKSTSMRLENDVNLQL